MEIPLCTQSQTQISPEMFTQICLCFETVQILPNTATIIGFVALKRLLWRKAETMLPTYILHFSYFSSVFVAQYLITIYPTA